MDADCNSPPSHSAFHGPHEMMEFIAKVDKKNEKDWVNPRFELWRPDEPLTWKFRG
jgi:hypothetical protein